ncbi:MAG: hypothetical protein GX125_05800 [Bacteroidales bacterium]|nr:hypothetical protein [Bacteroidales bacterium]
MFSSPSRFFFSHLLPCAFSFPSRGSGSAMRFSFTRTLSLFFSLARSSGSAMRFTFTRTLSLFFSLAHGSGSVPSE